MDYLSPKNAYSRNIDAPMTVDAPGKYRSHQKEMTTPLANAGQAMLGSHRVNRQSYQSPVGLAGGRPGRGDKGPR